MLLESWKKKQILDEVGSIYTYLEFLKEGIERENRGRIDKAIKKIHTRLFTLGCQIDNHLPR